MVQQPGHGALAAPGQAVLHFLRLFGDVDVDGRGGIDGVQAGQHGAQRIRRHGAQRMRRQAQARALRVAQGLEPRQQLEHRIGAADEAALALAGRLRAKAAGLVQHRQQGQADARAPGGAQHGQRQLRVVGVGAAIGVVVHVVEFADGRVARLQHFHVQAIGHGFQLRRLQAQGKAVHQLAPAPEAVFADRVAAVLGQPGHAALKGVRMQVGHAGQ